MIYLISILLLFILILIIINIYKNKYLESFQNVSINEYNKMMLNNDDKKIYNIGLSDNLPIDSEDCFDKCDKASCVKMHEMNRILQKCINCNATKNKCFKKSIIGGVCNDCDENETDKIDCYDVKNFGCPNPKDINYDIGVQAYYTEINDDNVNSPYNKKCVFCWNILDNI